jgi:hypothetical protein
LFHADAPKDVAPGAYDEEDASGDLSASRLTPRPEATGFRLDGMDALQHDPAGRHDTWLPTILDFWTAVTRRTDD